MRSISHLSKLIFILALFLTNSCTKQNSFSSIDDLVKESSLEVNGITVEQLMDKVDEGEMILLIDVREASEFNAGYIPGAVNICRGVIEFKISNQAFWDEAMLYMPLKDEEIIVYCKKGNRSILSAASLQKLGYSNVSYVIDGWKKWELTYPLIYEKNLDQNSHDSAGEVGGC